MSIYMHVHLKVSVCVCVCVCMRLCITVVVGDWEELCLSRAPAAPSHAIVSCLILTTFCFSSLMYSDASMIMEASLSCGGVTTKKQLVFHQLLQYGWVLILAVYMYTLAIQF